MPPYLWTPNYLSSQSLMLSFILAILAACTIADIIEPDHSVNNIKNRLIKGVTEPTIPMRSHSIYAPYVDSDLQNRWFDFGGSTIINTNKHIRLTQDRSSQAGYLWSRNPITQANFQVEVEFKIDGKSSSIYGDGMAMWLTKPSSDQIGPVFGSPGFGIFIDTFPNARHSYAFPRIIGISNNGYISYDVGKDGDGQEAGACSLSVRRSDVATKLRVTYVRAQFLEVLVHHEKWDEWTHCFTVWNHTLPDSPLLGFSAHTGEVSDAHDIIAVSTTGVVYHPPEDGKQKTKKVAWDSRGGIGSAGMGFGAKFLAIFAWIVKWGAVVGCVGLAGFGVKKYFAKYQKDSLKRF